MVSQDYSRELCPFQLLKADRFEHALVKGKRCSSANGFTVHANRYVGEDERKKLEDLIGYVARPAFSSRRLSRRDSANPAGDLVYELKTPWRDGTQGILLTRSE